MSDWVFRSLAFQCRVEVFTDKFAGSMQTRLHGRNGNSECAGNFVARAIFDVAHLVDRLILGRERRDGIVEELFHLTTRRDELGCGFGAREFAAFVVESRKLQKRQQRLALFELPADTPGDLGQPGAEGGGIAQLVEMTIRLDEGFHEDVFGVFAIAAGADHVAIDGILVLARKSFEIARRGMGDVGTHREIVPVEAWRGCTQGHIRESFRDRSTVVAHGSTGCFDCAGIRCAGRGLARDDIR